jgi:magnesium transporter
MLTVYARKGQSLEIVPLTPDAPFPSDPIWIDALSPTPEEEDLLRRSLNIDIPTHEEIWKNDALGRLHSEEGVSYLYTSVITKTDVPYPQTKPITFILSPQHLITIRTISPTSFKNFAARLQRFPHSFSNGPETLAGLMEDIITRVAYNSEMVVEELDSLSHRIFELDTPKPRKRQQNPSLHMKDTLRALGASADLNSQINESLHSIGRLLVFLQGLPGIGPDLKDRIAILMTDTKSLIEQSTFLADKVTFQLDATLGMINVEQNMIIKIFSVVAVFFLPPTLVSSIYGMNFQHMPELEWYIGYPFALALMALCAIVPHIYFRKRGWL